MSSGNPWYGWCSLMMVWLIVVSSMALVLAMEDAPVEGYKTSVLVVSSIGVSIAGLVLLYMWRSRRRQRRPAVSVGL